MRSGKIIKQNQVFFAKEEDVPKNFRDVIQPMEDLPDPGEEQVISTTEFEIKKRSGAKGWYDVINSASGKIMNTNAIRHDAAKKLLEELS